MSRVLSFALFLLVMLAVLGGMHYYLWARLVRDPGLAEPWRRSLTVLIALGAAAVPAGMIAWRLSRHGLPRVLPVATYAWLGLAFLLFCALLATEAMRWAAAAGSFLWASLQRLPDPPADPVRRLFLARAVAGGAALVAGGSSAWAFHRATSDPEVREVPVRLERLPKALSGLTIAQITDLHVGPTIRDREVRRVVELTNALRPDIVAVTGDLVDGTVPELRRTISQMARLEARYGVFFVTGNHEYYLPGTGTEDWMAELSRLGMRVLRNERVRVGDTGPGGASIDLAGIDDWRTEPSAPGPERLARALAGRDPERSLLLLAHQPLGVSQAVRAGAELQLSGHTHGGQIFPFSLLVSAVYRYARGLHRLEEAGARGQIYVSRGTGYWGPPMRLGEPAEITKVVLTA